MKLSWELNDIDQQLIDLALQEDLGLVFNDLTTEVLFCENDSQEGIAHIISKHPTPIIFSGLPIVRAVLDSFQETYHIKDSIAEGQVILPGQKILSIHTKATVLLMAERTILNFLRRLCAIATLTHEFVEKVKHTKCKILDTRKTTPGWRHLEKYAVLCGGGVNHRLGLYDAIIVKDTHIDLVGGMEKAMELLPEKKETLVIVEIRDMTELQTVLQLGRKKVDRILLDNMSIDLMQHCVAQCQGIFQTEASGGLNLQNIKAVAETGVDFASIGMITHSAGQVDLSMTAKKDV